MQAELMLGLKSMSIAVPGDRDPQPVRTFQAFTPELHQLAAWLKALRYPDGCLGVNGHLLAQSLRCAGRARL